VFHSDVSANFFKMMILIRKMYKEYRSQVNNNNHLINMALVN